MGSLYRPKYRGLGGTLNQSAVIWLKYPDALGVLRHESSETDKEQRGPAPAQSNARAPRVEGLYRP